MIKNSYLVGFLVLKMAKSLPLCHYIDIAALRIIQSRQTISFLAFNTFSFMTFLKEVDVDSYFLCHLRKWLPIKFIFLAKTVPIQFCRFGFMVRLYLFLQLVEDIIVLSEV